MVNAYWVFNRHTTISMWTSNRLKSYTMHHEPPPRLWYYNCNQLWYNYSKGWHIVLGENCKCQQTPNMFFHSFMIITIIIIGFFVAMNHKHDTNHHNKQSQWLGCWNLKHDNDIEWGWGGGIVLTSVIKCQNFEGVIKLHWNFFQWLLNCFFSSFFYSSSLFLSTYLLHISLLFLSRKEREHWKFWWFWSF